MIKIIKLFFQRFSTGFDVLTTNTRSLRYEELCLLPEEISSISSLIFNVFYHRSNREIPTAAAFTAVLNMSSSGHGTSRTEAVVYVVRR